MGVTITCREVGFDCDGRIEAADVDDALAIAAAHVTSVHGLIDVTPDLVDRVISVMRPSDGPAESQVAR